MGKRDQNIEWEKYEFVDGLLEDEVHDGKSSKTASINDSDLDIIPVVAAPGKK